MTPAQAWRQQLRDALLAARKERDAVRTAAVRSALSAIDNAETLDGVQLDAPPSATIAGGVAGLGAADVARRELADEQIRDLLHAEIDERLSAAEEFTSGGHAERATMLRAEAAVLTDLLGDV